MKGKIWALILMFIFLSIAIFIINLFSNFVVTSTPKDEILQDFRENENLFMETAIEVLNERNKSIYKNSHNSKNTSEIFNLGYVSIRKVNSDYVYFIRNSGFEFGQGVIYSVKETPPNDIYIYELKRINSNWFYFESE